MRADGWWSASTPADKPFFLLEPRAFSTRQHATILKEALQESTISLTVIFGNRAEMTSVARMHRLTLLALGERLGALPAIDKRLLVHKQTMSISEIFRVVTSDLSKDDRASVSVLKTPKILSIGGCVTQVIANRLGGLTDATHLWRVTVPCLMSRKVDGRTYFESNNHQVSERLNFEVTKQALHKLKTGGYKFLMFDPTSDFTNDYFEKDGCIISDITSGFVAPDWTWPEGFLAQGWERLSPKSHRYLEIYVYYLKELIALSEEIGVPLIILKRRACINKITSDGKTGLGDAESAEINWWMDLLWSRIDSLASQLNVLDLNGRLSITSFDAPYGEGRFHPIEEFYDYATYRLMYLMQFSDDLISEMMFHAYRERASRRLAIHTERDALIHERNGLIHERDSLRSSLDHLAAERDAMLVRERELANAERERQAQEITSICVARDAAVAETASQLLALQNEREALINERNALSRERDELVIERDRLAHERASADAERERHARDLTEMYEARDAALAANAGCLLALQNLQKVHEDLSLQHAALSHQQWRLFEELRLEGGPMALRDVLPLARAWRPVIKAIGKTKRFCRRLTALKSRKTS